MRTPLDELRDWWKRWSKDTLGPRWLLDYADDPYCWACVHANRYSSGCDAFPDEIPLPILLQKVIHNRPMPELGQKNDVVFELRPGCEDPFAEDASGTQDGA